MKKHYQKIVDEVFGNLYAHRTLRTIFDPYSSEYSETTLEEKINILKKILDSNKITLEQLIVDYEHFYSKELANKSHVVDSLKGGMILLLENLIQENNGKNN